VKDLLKVLGKRVHDLRAAKKWSQEEFAHVSGLHRTYIGQVERGEKNLSFANLQKISSALGISSSELLSGLEEGREARSGSDIGRPRAINSARRALEIQRLLNRLRNQWDAMERTMQLLEDLGRNRTPISVKSPGRPRKVANPFNK
jgi:transcriptional regulator with XRE-family HTH domain